MSGRGGVAGQVTADVDTGARYITQLFVEQRIGAMPVATDIVLRGIITRSDVPGALMRHYVLESWVEVRVSGAQSGSRANADFVIFL